ncbi:MAG TPA: T9SS type A sorting domain-containing protein [Bacteroidota bacterium]|nr:T9SS type A sorting domain-containing protein [Bacteroidota bacterium]
MKVRHLIFNAVPMLLLILSAPLHSQWSHNPSVNNKVAGASGEEYTGTIVSDGSGGAIVVWTEYTYDSAGDLYAQRIDASGNVKWASTGVPVANAPGGQYAVAATSDGAGGAVVTWEDPRDGRGDIYAQRIDQNGNLKWAEGGVGIEVGDATAFVKSPQIISDGSGGAIIAWLDDPSGDGAHPDIFAQRVDSAGEALWDWVDWPITWAGDAQAPTLASDGAGGAIVTWSDSRSDVGDIYAQRVNSGGIWQWSGGGIPICNAPDQQFSPVIISDGAGGAIVTWNDSRGGDFAIYAQRVDGGGNAQWVTNGVQITVPGSNPSPNPVIVCDGMGGTIIAWSESFNINAQHLDATGQISWGSNGASVAALTYSPVDLSMVNDGAGGALIAWSQFVDRGGVRRNTPLSKKSRTSGGGDPNYIYGQWLNSSGEKVHDTSGVLITTRTNIDQIVAAGDGTGGAIYAWSDPRNGPDNIYAQRVDRYMLLGTTEPSIARVADVANDQGGHVRVLWNPTYLDTRPNNVIGSYTVELGVQSTGLLGKVASAKKTQSTIYWQSAATVPANWSEGYSTVVSTAADSGLQGVPEYYFRVIARTADSAFTWPSAVDSGYSVDNIPPVGVGGGTAAHGEDGYIMLTWNSDRYDSDLMGYNVYRSTSAGFTPNESSKLALTRDTTFVDQTAIQGTTYYYRVAGEDVHGNVGATSGELSETALALELEAFTSSQSGAHIEIHWTTATETNVEGYNIERSPVASGSLVRSWTQEGYVQGSGTSTSPQSYTFSDSKVDQGTYAYRIKQLNRDGSFKYSQEIVAQVVVPNEFVLSQNYPNPFNPSTTLEFTVATSAPATLKVYNALGQEVATLFNGVAESGQFHSAVFDASKLPSGIYMARLESVGKQAVKKMLLVK